MHLVKTNPRCFTSRSPSSARLLRYAARLGSATLVGIHVMRCDAQYMVPYTYIHVYIDKYIYIDIGIDIHLHIDT